MTQTAILAKQDAQSINATWGFKNKIRNAAMKIAQRNTTYALTNAFAYGSVDGWGVIQGTSANGVANQVSTGTPYSVNGIQHCLKIGRTAGSALLGIIEMRQALESINSVPLQGKRVTLSFYAKRGADFSGASSSINVALLSGTSVDQSMASMGSWPGGSAPIATGTSLSSSWVRYSFTSPAIVPQGCNQLGIQIYYTPTGTAGADDNLYITGLQLEEGLQATAFEHLPMQVDLAICQRYYFKLVGIAVNSLSSAYAVDGTRTYGQTYFPVPMRVAPSALEQSGTATDYSFHTGVTTYTCSSVPTYRYAGTHTAETQFTFASGLTAGWGGSHCSVNTNGYLAWSAEL